MRRDKVRPRVLYRCTNQDGKRCTLLAVYAAPGPQHFVYSPAYRYSQGEATRQGLDRARFPERAYNVDQIVADAGAIFGWVACDHVIAIVDPQVIAADLAVAPTERFLPDGHADTAILRTSLSMRLR